MHIRSLQRRFRELLTRLRRLEDEIKDIWKPSWLEEARGEEEWWKRALVFQRCVETPVAAAIHRAVSIARNRELDSEFGSHIARTMHDDEAAQKVSWPLFMAVEASIVEGLS